MNFIFGFLLYIVLGAICSYFLPWWIIVPLGILIGFLFKGKSGQAFLLGIVSQTLLWLGTAAWLSMRNDGIMMEKMADLLGGLPPFALMIIIGLVGGITGGLSTWTGKNLKKMIDQ